MKYVITERQYRLLREDEVPTKKRDNLKSYLKELGYKNSSEYLGSLSSYVDIVYDSDFAKFSREEDFPAIEIRSNGLMYIYDYVLKTMVNADNKTIVNLGSYIFKFRGSDTRVDVSAILIDPNNIFYWRVFARSGDFGFGYPYISNANTFGKTLNKKINDKIIDIYNLERYNIISHL